MPLVTPNFSPFFRFIVKASIIFYAFAFIKSALVIWLVMWIWTKIAKAVTQIACTRYLLWAAFRHTWNWNP